MVIWTDPAKDDLHCIYDYIAKDSKYYAKQVIQSILDKTETLNDFPKIGKIVAESNKDDQRELSVYSYRVLYEIQASDIHILTIIHKRRDFNPNNIE